MRQPAIINIEWFQQAFPNKLADDVRQTGLIIMPRLTSSWLSDDRFQVKLKGEDLLVPNRIHLGPDNESQMELSETQRLIYKCLMARSMNGFQRQDAVQQILKDMRPWTAPYILSCAGEYVVEIISDICHALPSIDVDALASFIRENPEYWHTTKQRIASYWNVYYRPKISKSEYAGFKLIRELEKASKLQPS